VGQWATEDLHVHHVGQLEVIDVVALTYYKSVVLYPLTAWTQATDLNFV
jgi:hypothetical protein